MRPLSFDIIARNLTAGAFAQVNQSVGGMETRFQAAGSKIGAVLGRAGVVAAGLTTLAAAINIRQSLELWDRQEQAVTRVETAVRSTGMAAGLTARQLQDMAAGMQKITTFGDEDILAKVTAPLLTFTQISGPQFEQAQRAVLDLSTVLEMDLKSAALQVGKALNDPARGLSMLSRAGIQFSEEQTNIIKQLQKTGEIAKAQEVILTELATQFGGQSQAAAERGLGPLRQLSNEWGDLQEKMGGVVAQGIPLLTGGLKLVNQGIDLQAEGLRRHISLFTRLKDAIVDAHVAALRYAVGAPDRPVVTADAGGGPGQTIAGGKGGRVPELFNVGGYRFGGTDPFDELRAGLKAQTAALTAESRRAGGTIAASVGEGLAETDPWAGLRESTDTAFGYVADRGEWLARSIGSNFVRMNEQGQVEFASLRSIGAQIFNQLASNALSQFFAPVGQLFSSFGRGFGFSGGGAAGPGFAGWFADGGNIPAGMVGIAGERGPELIEGPANVVPMKSIGAAGPVYSPVYNIDARGADAGVEQRLAAMLAAYDRKRAPEIIREAARAAGGRYGLPVPATVT